MQPYLTLRKQVVGGAASPADWTLRAQGPVTVQGTDGVRVPVRVGQYQLSESEGPVGYTAGSWSCTGGQQTSATSVVVTVGQDVVCTVTNTWTAPPGPTLTLVKQLVGGGLARVGDFTLRATGPDVVAGRSGTRLVTRVPVDPGAYTLSESTIGTIGAGYAAGPWACTGGTLTGARLVLAPTDGDVVCTVTNTWTGGTLTLVKQVVGGTAPPGAWTLEAAGPAVTVSGASGTPDVTRFPVPAGRYALSETGPANYSASGWSCTSGQAGPAAVDVPTGGDVTCTITNTVQRASLTLVKVVGPGGPADVEDFTLTAAGGGSTITGTSGTPAVTRAAVDVGSSWTLSESGPAGYEASAWRCDAGADVVGDTVTVTTAADVTCTVTNTWAGGTLTLAKRVLGSSMPPGSWTLAASSPEASLTGASGSPAVTDVPVPAGSYTLSEQGPGGFAQEGWTCTGAVVDGDTVEVTPGADVTCTATNRATSAHLTLVKDLDNAGGTALPTDWVLSADGPVDLAGRTGEPAVTRVPVGPGAYALAESPADTPGYDAGPWLCSVGRTVLPVVDDVLTVPETWRDDVPFTEDVVCRITNAAAAPTLTLVKDLVNTGGGPAAAEDFVLLAIGPSVVVGPTGGVTVTDVPVVAGTYDLREIGAPRYGSDGWSCADDDGGTPVPTPDDRLVLALDDDVTCTVTNRWEGATLTLVKEVVGGPSAATDWTLVGSPTSGGAVGVSGSPEVTRVPIPAGAVTLREEARTPVAAAGYRSEGWDCGPALPVSGDDVATVQVPPGTDATCTVTNTWTGGTLTLVKRVEGPADPGLWTLSASNLTMTVAGATGEPGVTEVPVVAGGYALAESDGVAGYRQEGWECTGGTLDGAGVQVPEGGDVECVVTNVLLPDTEPTPTPTDPPTSGPIDPVDPVDPADPGRPGGPWGADDVAAARDRRIAATGADVGAAVALTAALLLVGGAALVASRRRRP